MRNNEIMRIATSVAVVCAIFSVSKAYGNNAVAVAKSDINLSPISSSICKQVSAKNDNIESKRQEIEQQIKQEKERKAREEALRKQREHNAICENLGGVDQSWIDVVNSKLSVLPTSLIDEFRADGWHYYCTTLNLDATFYGGQYGGVMGTTNYDEHRILVEPRWDAMNTAVVHEMGHWYDWHLGTITNTSEFMNIYYNETNAFKSTFQIHSYYEQKELFAEAFWRFYTDNDLLRSSCPQLYAFMSRVCPAP